MANPAISTPDTSGLTPLQKKQIAKGKLTVDQANKRNRKASNVANNQGGAGKPKTDPYANPYLKDLTANIPDDVNYVRDQIKNAITNAGDIADKGLDYSKNNVFTDQAKNFNDYLLTGGMQNNPWEEDLWGDLEGIQNPLTDAINALLGYTKGGPTGVTRPRGGTSQYIRGAYGELLPNPNYQGGTGGKVPDTVGPEDTFFAQKIKELFDPSTLDPANDPTMAPLLEAMRREAGENHNAMLQDLAMQSEGSGLFGSGMHEYVMNRAREEGMESLDQQIAMILKGSRDDALARRMQGLDLTNTRDLSAMKDLTDRAAIAAQERASGASSAAASADAAEGRRLQAISMLLGAGSDILGLKGNMAGLRQGGQLDALSKGLGFANLGLDGYKLGLAGNQNQMAGLDLFTNLISGINNANLADQANKMNHALGRAGIGVQRQQLDLSKLGMLNDSAMNMMQMLSMLGGLGGVDTSDQPGTPYIPGPNANTQALLAGLGTLMSNYNNNTNTNSVRQ